MTKVRVFKDQGSVVLLDLRFDHMVNVKFYGLITEKVLLEFTTWYRDYLGSLAPSARFVMISDPREVPSTSSTIRGIAAEEAKKLSAGIKAHNIETFLILDNPLLRGGLTAIGWLTDKKIGQPVKDMHEAVTSAVQALTRAGLPAPAGLDATTYESQLAALKQAQRDR